MKCFSMVITDCQQGQSVMTLSCWQLVDNCKNSFVLHIMNTLFWPWPCGSCIQSHGRSEDMNNYGNSQQSIHAIGSPLQHKSITFLLANSHCKILVAFFTSIDHVFLRWPWGRGIVQTSCILKNSALGDISSLFNVE